MRVVNYGFVMGMRFGGFGELDLVDVCFLGVFLICSFLL